MTELHEEPDWKAMYLTLFHGITDALSLIPFGVHTAERLKRALTDAEEIYIRGGE